jgi:hypothetical protein
MGQKQRRMKRQRKLTPFHVQQTTSESRQSYGETLSQNRWLTRARRRIKTGIGIKDPTHPPRSRFQSNCFVQSYEGEPLVTSHLDGGNLLEGAVQGSVTGEKKRE